MFTSSIDTIDSEGTYVVRYRYDSWGNLLYCTPLTQCIAANHNPFIYKGYMYDEETGWYYLQSRYYMPSLCRFLSPDSIDYVDSEAMGGLNLYAYCYGDPINYCDPSGHIPLDTLIDIVFACLSLKELIKNPSWENAGWFALDLACFIIPYATGGSTAVKGIVKGVNGADNFLDATKVPKYIMKNAYNVVILGQNMDRVHDAAKKIGGGIVYGGLDDLAEISLKYGNDVANIWHI